MSEKQKNAKKYKKVAEKAILVEKKEGGGIRRGRGTNVHDHKDAIGTITY